MVSPWGNLIELLRNGEVEKRLVDVAYGNIPPTCVYPRWNRQASFSGEKHLSERF